MLKYSLSLMTGIIFLFGASPTGFAKLVKNGNQSLVSFTAKGTGGMTIVGKTSDLSIQDDDKTLRVTVPLKNLTTGISLRDKHLREKYLQVDKYPQAELTVDRKALTSAIGDKLTGSIKGAMKIHGKTKTVDVHCAGKRDGQIIKVTASAHLNIQDYEIPIPSFLGISVKPEIDITATFEVWGN
jgi:polyisoprenoid-binding protein YceI